MSRMWLKVSGATLLLAVMASTSVHAQFEAAGNMAVDGWNQLGPLGNPNGANPGITNMNRNWIAPLDVSDPSWNPAGIAFDSAEIDFGLAASTGHGYGNLVPEHPVFYTLPALEAAFPAANPIPRWEAGEGVNFQDQAVHLSNTIGGDIGGALPNDNVMYVSTSYIENDTDSSQILGLCTSSDDAIQVWVNNCRVVNVAAARGSGGRGGCQETTPALIPPGVSKITTLVWEGGGGHNFRLAILGPDGSKLGQGDEGITYLGHGGGELEGQTQAKVTRTVVGAEFDCPNEELAVTVQSENDEGDADEEVEVVECITTSGNVEDLVISDLPAGTVVEDITQPGGLLGGGFFDAFVVSGPKAQIGGSGHAPGADRIRADYCVNADGSQAQEDFEPIPGTATAPDFGGLVVHASGWQNPGVDNGVTRGIAVNPGNCGLDFNAHGGGGDQIMHDTWNYLEVTADTSVRFGVGSDDSVIIVLDGPGHDYNELFLFNGGRGWGGNCAVQNETGCVDLSEGIYRVHTKTFEGGGGHGIKLRITNCDGSAFQNGNAGLDPDDIPGGVVIGRKLRIPTTRGGLADGLSYTVSLDAPGSVNISGNQALPVGFTGGDSGNYSFAASTGPVGVFENSHAVRRDVPDFPSVPLEIVDGAGGDDTVYRMGHGGRDIWNDGDEMEFAYKAVTGNFDATVRVVSIEEPNDGDGHRWGRLGLMARQSCHVLSRNQFLYLASGTPNPPDNPDVFQNIDQLSHQWRDQHQARGVGRIDLPTENLRGQPNTGAAQSDRRPEFLRMIRVGQTFHTLAAWADPDDETQPGPWNRLQSRTHQGFPETILVGFAIGGHGTLNGGRTPIVAEFTFECSEFVPPEFDCPGGIELGDEVLSADYEGDGDAGGSSNLAFGTRSGRYNPQLVDGRLRLTDQAIGGSSTVAYHSVDADLGDGFVAEFDVFMTKDGLPGDVNPADGMTFTVISNPGLCVALSQDDVTIVSGDDLDTYEFVGDDEGGRSDGTYDADTNIYTIISSSDKDIWTGGDDMAFQYAVVEGDFDIMVNWDVDGDGEPNISTATQGRWGKNGPLLMQLTEEGEVGRCQRRIMSQLHPNGQDVARAAGRRATNGDCNGGQYEVGNPFGGDPFPAYHRVSRRGDQVYVFQSDDARLGTGELDPANSCCWYLVHTEIYGGLPEALAVGVGASKHDNSPDGAEGDFVGEYTLLEPSDDPVFGCTNRHGDGGGGLGYHGNTMFTRNYNSPSFAVEMDNWVGGGNNEVGDGGSPGNDGAWHSAVDQGGLVDSEQTSAQFGVATADLPDIFDPAGVHMTVEYRPNGDIAVWAKSNADGGEAGDDDDDDRGIQIIGTSILPLMSGDYAVGFTAGTGGATATQEVDNLSVRPLICIEGFFKTPMDWNEDGSGDLSDAVALFNHLFLGGVAHPCGDITRGGTIALMNGNVDNAIDLSDGVSLLNFLFLGGPTPTSIANANDDGCLLVLDCDDESTNCPPAAE